MGDCSDCPNGLYANRERTVCERNDPVAFDDSVAEKMCAKGEFLEMNHCYACPQGKYAGDKVNTCVRCETGTFQSEVGQYGCDSCPKGKHSSPDGTYCLQSANCYVGHELVALGWKGPGMGDNYCNLCSCQPGGLSCSRRVCDIKFASCSHVKCQYKEETRWDGSTVGTIQVHHHHSEAAGKNHHCQYQLFNDDCRCYCFGEFAHHHLTYLPSHENGFTDTAAPSEHVTVFGAPGTFPHTSHGVNDQLATDFH
jgi:hypothetical protein